MKRWYSLAVVLALLAIVNLPAQDKKKPTDAIHDPAKAVANLDVHPELQATLFAHEDIVKPGDKRDIDNGGLTNPTNLDIDHRGRVWVCDVMNYRGNNGKRPKGDRILIYVEHVLAVREAGALGGELEHRRLGVTQPLGAVRPVAARVLEVRPEHALEERGRDLVVLRVRRRRLDRDVAPAQLRDERLVARLLVLDAAPLLPQPERADRADPRPQQRLGDAPGVDDPFQHARSLPRPLAAKASPRQSLAARRAGRRSAAGAQRGAEGAHRLGRAAMVEERAQERENRAPGRGRCARRPGSGPPRARAPRARRPSRTRPRRPSAGDRSRACRCCRWSRSPRSPGRVDPCPGPARRCSTRRARPPPARARPSASSPHTGTARDRARARTPRRGDPGTTSFVRGPSRAASAPALRRDTPCAARRHPPASRAGFLEVVPRHVVHHDALVGGRHVLARGYGGG